MISTTFQLKNFDATIQNNAAVFDVSNLSQATISVAQEQRVADGSNATFTLERSNDLVGWFALETPTTVTPDNITAMQNLKSFAYLRVRVSTAATDSLNRVSIVIGSQNAAGTNSVSSSHRIFGGPSTIVIEESFFSL